MQFRSLEHVIREMKPKFRIVLSSKYSNDYFTSSFHSLVLSFGYFIYLCTSCIYLYIFRISYKFVNIYSL